jgi:hypothetical protein
MTPFDDTRPAAPRLPDLLRVLAWLAGGIVRDIGARLCAPVRHKPGARGDL